MIRFEVKKKLYKYERIIFPEKTVESKCDISRYMRFYDIPENLKNIAFDTYRTPVINLLETEEEILARYSKDVRYEVRRAGREEISYAVYDNLDIKKDKELILDVETKYYAFCDQIEMPELKHNLNETEFEIMIGNGNVVISKAEFLNGWTYHVYQVDGKHALLWFSFSDYRKESSNKSLAGWANRGLHNFDIMYFKNHGYELYDWGNIASEQTPNHIDKFKMAFGGELKTAYCCFIGNTFKGKLLIKLREMRNKH